MVCQDVLQFHPCRELASVTREHRATPNDQIRKTLVRRNEKIQLKLCRKTHPKSFRKMDDKIIGRHIAQQPSPDDFEVMREGLFISKPEQLQQSPLLTEDEGSYCKDENQQKWARRRGCGRICSTCAAITLCFEEGTGLVDTNGWVHPLPGGIWKDESGRHPSCARCFQFFCANREFLCERSITVFWCNVTNIEVFVLGHGASSARPTPLGCTCRKYIRMVVGPSKLWLVTTLAWTAETAINIYQKYPCMFGIALMGAPGTAMDAGWTRNNRLSKTKLVRWDAAIWPHEIESAATQF